MEQRLLSFVQPWQLFLPGLREEISILTVIYPMKFSFQRKVGSGFCPILSQRERRDGARRAPPFGGGRPRAMLAPDASVGKTEKIVILPCAAKYLSPRRLHPTAILPIVFYLFPASQFLNRVTA